jgi:hypothetical protein
MGLEQGEPGHGDGAERWHVEDAFEIDDCLLPYYVHASSYLNIQ